MRIRHDAALLAAFNYAVKRFGWDDEIGRLSATDHDDVKDAKIAAFMRLAKEECRARDARRRRD